MERRKEVRRDEGRKGGREKGKKKRKGKMERGREEGKKKYWLTIESKDGLSGRITILFSLALCIFNISHLKVLNTYYIRSLLFVFPI